MKRPPLAALLAVACFGVIPVAHAQFEKTDPQAEIELGRRAAREIEAAKPLSKNTAMIERVKRVGQSLADAMPHRAYPFEFKVIADSEFNAFCLPGGFMYVNEGLLGRLTDDGALAYVMGHEMTHAAHRHYAKAMRTGSAEMVLGMLANIATKSDIGSQLVGLQMLSFSRTQESDADEGGLELAFDAGYDPESALAAVQAMIDLEKKAPKIPEYLRDHPAGKDRYAAMSTRGKELKQRGRAAISGSLPVLDASTQAASLTGRLPVAHTTPNPYSPLAVGNSWTYRVRSRDGANSVYTVRITDSVRFPDGRIVYRAQTELSGAGIVPFLLCTDETGLWRRSRPTDARSLWRPEYQFAPPPGDPTFEILPPETVSLPCGTFAATETRKLRRMDTRYTTECLFGKDVGLLQTTCAETGITETLIAYKREQAKSVSVIPVP